MKWYYVVLLACVVIGPFDALYMYIKSEKRREALKKKKGTAKSEESDDQ